VIRKTLATLAGVGLALFVSAAPAGDVTMIEDIQVVSAGKAQIAAATPAADFIIVALPDAAAVGIVQTALPIPNCGGGPGAPTAKQAKGCGPAAIAGPNAGGANLASLSGPDDPTDPPVTGGIQAHDPNNPEPDPAEA
jgi:hypothetical protein